MANRRIAVELSATIGQYERNMRSAGAATEKFARTAKASGDAVDSAAKQSSSASQQVSQSSEEAARAHQKAAEAARDREGALDTLGTGLVAFGTVTVAALGAAAKAAMDWETAWTGVTKTVDGTPEQLAALEAELRGLATTLPITHEEIAGVAEAAGQLGVAREDITGFTKTMVDLGQTTNLTAEEAATSIAQMMNVMGTASGDVDNLGSALVALGNDGASTEKEILEMAQRIAGTGKLIGASESDILALANTMSSLGIRAEAGGSAASRVLQELYTSVQEGGEELEGFAKVAGMSAQEFATAFKTDPIGAMNAFTQGLGRIKDSGGNVIGTLESLGITSTEDTRALLALSGAGDLLTESLKTGNQAWKENTALADEAAKRYATAESRIKTAWNQIRDAAIDSGAAILPMIADLVEAVADMADWFSNLPAPVQAGITALSGIAGVASLAGGALLLMLPKAQEASRALQSLGKNGQRADRGLRRAGKGAAIATTAIAGLQIAAAVGRSIGEAAPSVQEFTNATRAMIEAGDPSKLNAMAESGGFLQTEINGLADAVQYVGSLNGFDKLGLGISNVITLGAGFGTHMEDQVALVEQYDAALTSMAAGGSMDQAAAGFREATKVAREQGTEISELIDLFPGYRDAILQQAEATGASLNDQQLFNAMMGKLPPKLKAAAEEARNAAAADAELEGSLENVGIAADGTVESLSEYLDLLFATGLATLSTRDAQRQYEAAIDDVGKTVDELIKKNGSLAGVLNKTRTDFNLNTAAGRTAAAAFDEVASSGLAMASSMAESGASQGQIQNKLQGTYKDLINAAGAFGITGGKAKALAREVLGVPDGVSIKSWFEKTARKEVENLKAEMFSLPDGVDIDSFMSDKAYRMSVLTKQGIDNIPNSDTVRTFMEKDAHIEALKTRAAVLGIPAKDVIDSFMSSAARGEADKTTAAVLGIPEGADVSSWMSNKAKVEAWATQAALEAIERRVMIDIITRKTTIISTKKGDSYPSSTPAQLSGPAAYEDGGRIPRLADGGRLPLTGPGTETVDGILGVSSLTGQPTAYVNAGEWVVNDDSSEKYNRVLSAINRDDPAVHHLAGLASGGRAGNLRPMVGNYAAAAPNGAQPQVAYHWTLNNVPMDNTRAVVESINFEMTKLENSGKYD